jgi:ABC-type branched-subunit amino acid transport system substrate-binding protein
MLLLTACGARLSPAQVPRAPAAGPAQGADVGGPAASATPADEPAAAAATTVVTVASGGGGEPGAPTDDGTPAAEAATGGCTPQPVDEVGVTGTTITLANVGMLTGPIPGAGQPGLDGTRAFVEYVNSRGGVCGRRLVLVTGDDRTDTGQGRAEYQRLSREAFGFVGGESIVDGGAASAVAGTNIPVTQVAVDDAALASPNFFSPSPIEPTGTTLGSEPMWRYFHQALGLQRPAIVVLGIAAARQRAETYRADIERAGLEIAGYHEVALTETNWAAVAQQMENEGADGFISLLDQTGSARLAQAIRQVDWHPLVTHYGAQNYGSQFLELAGPAAEGTLIPLAFDIFEDAPTNPTVATFLDWFHRVAPGREPDFYAAMGWASGDMMVQALEAAGPAPTRDAVLAWLGRLTVFDAHGFLAPCNPAGKVTSPQFMVATVRNGRWERSYPASGFTTG